MLQKSHRLTTGDVATVIKSGRSTSVGSIRIKFIHRGEKTSFSRFAVVVSKKVAKLAVRRNTLRRQIYTYLRAKTTHSPIDACIFLQKSDLQKEAIRKDLVEALRQISVR